MDTSAPPRSGWVKRLRRLAFGVCLGLATTSYIRSFSSFDVLCAAGPGQNTWHLTSSTGQLEVQWIRRRTTPFGDPLPPPPHYFQLPWPARLIAPTSLWSRLGFGYGRTSDGLSSIIFPYWVLVILVSIPLVHDAVRGLRRRRRLARGRCMKCGYDLRGTPGASPECGAATTAPLTSGAPS